MTTPLAKGHGYPLSIRGGPSQAKETPRMPGGHYPWEPQETYVGEGGRVVGATKQAKRAHSQGKGTAD